MFGNPTQLLPSIRKLSSSTKNKTELRGTSGRLRLDDILTLENKDVITKYQSQSPERRSIPQNDMVKPIIRISSRRFLNNNRQNSIDALRHIERKFLKKKQFRSRSQLATH